MDIERDIPVIRQPPLQPVNEDLNKIRKRLSDLMSSTDLTPQLMEANLLGVVVECQRLRAKEIKGAENMERQAQASRAKAEGLSQMASIVYHVVNGFATGAERMKAEEEELAEIDKIEEVPKKRKYTKRKKQ